MKSHEIRPGCGRLFNAAKLMQSDLNAWKDCVHPRCQEKRSCLGGPRGTCRRTGGWPLCTTEGQQRLEECKLKGKWQRTTTYDRETPHERDMRRINADMFRLDALLKAEGV